MTRWMVATLYIVEGDVEEEALNVVDSIETSINQGDHDTSKAKVIHNSEDSLVRVIR
jgi:hypothetical protein